MTAKVSRSLRNFSKIEKTVVLIFYAIFLLFIFYMYLIALQVSLKLYSTGIKWLFDMAAYPISSVPDMLNIFFSVLLILGYPIIFSICTVSCILFSISLDGKKFSRSFFFPGVFIFVCYVLTRIGLILI